MVIPFNKANWEKYSEKTLEFSNKMNISNNINEGAANIKKIIISSANETIPIARTNTIKENRW